jgi:hypothetical protein
VPVEPRLGFRGTIEKIARILNKSLVKATESKHTHEYQTAGMSIYCRFSCRRITQPPDFQKRTRHTVGTTAHYFFARFKYILAVLPLKNFSGELDLAKDSLRP